MNGELKVKRFSIHGMFAVYMYVVYGVDHGQYLVVGPLMYTMLG